MVNSTIRPISRLRPIQCHRLFGGIGLHCLSGFRTDVVPMVAAGRRFWCFRASSTCAPVRRPLSRISSASAARLARYFARFPDRLRARLCPDGSRLHAFSLVRPRAVRVPAQSARSLCGLLICRCRRWRRWYRARPARAGRSVGAVLGQCGGSPRWGCSSFGWAHWADHGGWQLDFPHSGTNTCRLLQDIINTNTLWATHHCNLNDLPHRLCSPMPLPTRRRIDFLAELLERFALTGAA